MVEWMNHKGVYRTALATQCLLNKNSKLIQDKDNIENNKKIWFVLQSYCISLVNQNKKKSKNNNINNMMFDGYLKDTLYIIFCWVIYLLVLYGKQACCAGCRTDPSQCNSTSRQIPPIQQNRRNCWTNSAI